MILFRSSRPDPLEPAALIEAVEALHLAVDQATTPLEAMHAERLVCQRGCTGCCRDELTVFEIEAALIQFNASEVLEQAPHAPGACAFLDEGGSCRIYQHRPYVCRTQGLPLRWIEPTDDGEIEYRDICPLNDDKATPCDTLDEAHCLTLGPFEAQLAQLQSRQTGGALKRVPLRGLFASEKYSHG